ncbi:MAG: C40 family peptidase, partial [Clostridiales bacterium]|nr:C40 family peptidase [Clostridiales bacterium]
SSADTSAESSAASSAETEDSSADEEVSSSLTSSSALTSSSSSASSSSSSGTTGADVVAYAVQFVGNPYVWGGTSLTNGCDCSGFVVSVYAHFGYSLPHFSGSLRYCGTGVSYSDAQPGDIICYDGHVGIYIGDGQMVNAFDTEHGIIICAVNTSRLVAVRRILT